MEKILKALCDEIVQRVITKMTSDTSDMVDFLKIKIKAENVEGLDEMVRDMAEESALEIIKNCTIEATIIRP